MRYLLPVSATESIPPPTPGADPRPAPGRVPGQDPRVQWGLSLAVVVVGA